MRMCGRRHAAGARRRERLAVAAQPELVAESQPELTEPWWVASASAKAVVGSVRTVAASVPGSELEQRASVQRVRVVSAPSSARSLEQAARAAGDPVSAVRAVRQLGSWRLSALRQETPLPFQRQVQAGDRSPKRRPLVPPVSAQPAQRVQLPCQLVREPPNGPVVALLWPKPERWPTPPLAASVPAGRAAIHHSPPCSGQ